MTNRAPPQPRYQRPDPSEAMRIAKQAIDKARESARQATKSDGLTR